MELTLSSETSAFILRTPGKFPKEHRLHSEHGEKSKNYHNPVLSENKEFKSKFMGLAAIF